MRMHDPVYLQRVRELCDAHGAFMIADEIATGFGRTGTLFACEQAGVMPDLMCLSGPDRRLPALAAVLATQALYDAFLDDSRERLHSQLHRQPAGLRRGTGDAGHLPRRRCDRAQPGHRLGDGHAGGTVCRPPARADVRRAGMVVAFELSRDGNKRTPFDPGLRLGLQAYRPPSSAAWCCARWATCCTGCHPTAWTTNNWSCWRTPRWRPSTRRLHARDPLPHRPGAAQRQTVTLPEETANHLVRVMRLREGDTCVLFNGDGHDYSATLTVAGKREVQVLIDAVQAIDNESPLAITLLRASPVARRWT